jgi:hypothetical protein
MASRIPRISLGRPGYILRENWLGKLANIGLLSKTDCFPEVRNVLSFYPKVKGGSVMKDYSRIRSGVKIDAMLTLFVLDDAEIVENRPMPAQCPEKEGMRDQDNILKYGRIVKAGAKKVVRRKTE